MPSIATSIVSLLPPRLFKTKNVKNFEDFFKNPNFFYKTIGVEAYEGAYGRKTPSWLRAVCYGNMLNLNFCLLTEMISVYLAVESGQYLDIPMLFVYMGFISLCNIKISTIAFYKTKTTDLMDKLRQLYKNESSKLNSEENRIFFQFYERLGFCYIIAFMTLMWTYNLYPLINYMVHSDELEPVLPYGWMPESWKHIWPYYIFYASQDAAGYTSSIGQLANDLLLCAVATQLIMHYRNLAALIESADNEQLAPEKSGAFLNYVIDYHQQLLSISAAVNNVFGVSLLLNFISSSLMVCFLGFLMTVGAETFILIKLFLFFFCSLLQIYMICKCAQELIESSESIGHAVYNQHWPDYADLRYRKMLILLIQRAQKPAVLQATTFLNISLITMTDLLQLSYKFFALLRTLYGK